MSVSPKPLMSPSSAAGTVAVPGSRPALAVSSHAASLPAGWIDLTRALASQLIVWHHFALYGPLCDAAADLAPAVFEALAGQARLVVQLFLVIGGFLAASSLWPDPGAVPRATWRELPSRAWQRYQRLARPYLVAVAAAVVAALAARQLIDHPTIPAAPEGWQLVAHLLLWQDILGFDSLSAGFWYVAVDFQLFVAWAALAALAGTLGSRLGAAGRRWLALALVGAVVVGSLAVWNLDASLDVWAPYFAGAYGLGALACWARRAGRWRSAGALGLLLLTALALVLEWRSRVALAGATAVALVMLPPSLPRLAGGAARRGIAFLARVSYPVFLLHYPVLLAVGALVHALWPGDALAASAGLLLAWVASLLAGAALQRATEGG